MGIRIGILIGVLFCGWCQVQFDTAMAVSKDRPVRIVFAGDAMMDGSVKEAIRKNGPHFPFTQVRSEVQRADFAFMNLETSVTNRTRKDTNQIYNYSADPIALQGVKDAGFDLVSIANNHTMDFLQQGFSDTLANLDHYGLPYVGGGHNEAEAYAGKTFAIGGYRVKFMAVSRFLPTGEWFAGPNRAGIANAYEQYKVIQAVRREREGCDYLLLYIHWGVAGHHRPEPWQRQFAKEIIDAGADAVIGSHPHALQGFEYYRGKPIAYSIGNFLFPNYVRKAKAETGLLSLVLDRGRIGIQFSPYEIRDDQVIKLGKTAWDNRLRHLQTISYGVEREGNRFMPKGLNDRPAK